MKHIKKDANHDATLIAELYANHDYLEAYCKHTDLRVQRDPQQAVGGKWNELGYLQFWFLCKHGLEPQHRLFDLRLRHFERRALVHCLSGSGQIHGHGHF